MDNNTITFYGTGISAVYNKDNNETIEVYLLDKYTMVDGNIQQKKTFTSTTTDINGSVTQNNVERKVTIVAKWYNQNGGNCVSAPNVVEGEYLNIFKNADTDEYYWDTVFRSVDIRRHERVMYVYSNKKEGGSGIKSFKPGAIIKQAWTILVDTFVKCIHIATSDNDGEATTYDILFDLKDGRFILSDKSKNTFQLFSVDKGNVKAGTWRLIGGHTIELRAGEAINIDTKNITVAAKQIGVSAEELSCVISENFSVSCKGGVGISGSSIDVAAAEHINVSTALLKLTGNKVEARPVSLDIRAKSITLTAETSGDDLVNLLCETLETLRDEVHQLPDNTTTSMTPGSKQKIDALIARFRKFKG